MRHPGNGNFRAAGRGVAFVGSWLTAVAIASAGYGAEAGPNPFEVVPFAGPFAVAVAVAAGVSWTVGGDRRRAAAFAMSLGVFLIGILALIYLVFWGFGEEVRVRLGTPRPAYEGHRRELVSWSARLARDSMAGAITGTASGAIAGGLLALARRRPRLAGAVSVGLLLASGVSAPSLIAEATRLLLDWRSEGGLWRAASISKDELATLLGAFSGSVVGAILAGLIQRIAPGRSREAPARNPA